MWSCWKQKTRPHQCENAFWIWSHIVLFSYTLILKHITLLPSKWICMISLLILNLSFLLICRRRLENCAEWRANFTTRFSGWKGNPWEPASPEYPFLLSSLADPFCRTAVGASLPVAIFWYSLRCIYILFDFLLLPPGRAEGFSPHPSPLISSILCFKKI